MSGVPIWEGHTGTVIGEVITAPTHMTGGYVYYLFESDQNPGMVVEALSYNVKFL